MYKQLVRPLLEYGSTVWSPWHKKDIEALEKAQNRCLRLCNDMVIECESLKDRRMYIDLCETYKYLHGHYKTSSETLFSHPSKTLRGHSLKISKAFSKTNTRKFFFPNRVCDRWNELSEDVVTAPTLATFKKRLRSLPNGQKG